MQSLPADVLVAIVLEDLPIDIDEANASAVVGRGASWWYLTCECDDFFANIVEDVISFCSVEQARSLCLVRNSSGETLLQRASPRCKLAMETALRVAGRFEFDESKPLSVDNTRGLRVYEAYDHGDIDDGEAEGKKVSLRLFSNYKAFEEEVRLPFSQETFVKRCSLISVFPPDLYSSPGSGFFCRGRNINAFDGPRFSGRAFQRKTRAFCCVCRRTRAVVTQRSERHVR